MTVPVTTGSDGEFTTTVNAPATDDLEVQHPDSIAVEDVMVEQGQVGADDGRGFDVGVPDFPTDLTDPHIAFTGPDGQETRPAEFRLELGDDGTATAHVYREYAEEYDAESGEDGGEGGQDDESSLPRTGAQVLGGVGAGAALLGLGAATVLITRRRRASHGPSDL